MTLDTKNLRIVDITTYHPIKEKLGTLSREVEGRVKYPEMQNITFEKINKDLREIIELIEKL